MSEVDVGKMNGSVLTDVSGVTLEQMSKAQTPEAEERPSASEQTPEEEKAPGPYRRGNMWLMKIGVMIFVTFVCCILFFFMLLRYQGFASSWSKVMKAAEPIIIGLVLAYLLNPVLKAVEGLFLKLFTPRMKSEEKAKKMSRSLGIVVSVLFLLAVIALLIAAVVPSITANIKTLMGTATDYMRDFSKMLEQLLNRVELPEAFDEKVSELIADGNEWIQKALGSLGTTFEKASNYFGQFTSGVLSVVKTLLNFIIGIIVAVYVLNIKEELSGQSKKVILAVFKPKQANIVIELFRKADEIFGGFIIGKIVDSAIIGVICYVGCMILKIPDAMLVAVFVGVTNIIPVFGPFIGAVPSLFIVVIQSPWHALYLLIFIIVLQQVDGNIIGPKILGSSTGLSAFWVMFAILIGGGLFGFLGILLGVPVFAMIYYIFRRLVNHSIYKRGLPPETEKYVNAVGVDVETCALNYHEEPKTEKRK